MDNGWVKLHRKLLDNPIITKPVYLTLWIVLLLKANHKETKMIWNGSVIVIKEGQFITGRNALAQETGIPSTTVERILNFLENGHQIEQQKTTKYRLITIINWKDYQNKDKTSDNKRTTNGQQMDTNKNDKKEKNNKKENSPVFLKEISKETIDEFIIKFKCESSEIKTKAHALFDYCESKGRKYKNYKALLSNALRKDFGERPPKAKIPIYDTSSGVAKIVGYK